MRTLVRLWQIFCLSLFALSAHAACDYYIGAGGSDSNAGTTGSPWAITAINSKQATYRGKNVCLQDGTYSIYSLLQAGANDGYAPVLNIDGGSSGSPTVISALNDRAAILECSNSGTITTVNSPAIGQVSATHMGYVTIDGLKLQNCGSKVIELGGSGGLSSPSQFSGWTVKNNEITGQNTSGFSPGNNFSSVELIGGLGPLISNNYFHDNIGNVGPTNGNHYTSAVQWYTTSATYQYNTVINAPGFYGKESGNSGTTIQFNHIDTSGWTSVDSIEDFVGTSTTATGNTTTIKNNVLIAPQLDMRPTLGGSTYLPDHLVFNNNTIVVTSSGQSLGLAIQIQTGDLSYFNNIVYSSASGDLNLMAFNTDAAGLSDYDLYYSSTATYVYGYFSAKTSGSRNGTSSFTTWKGLQNVAGDTHSITGSDPLFVGSGSGASYYRLQSGSPAKNAGKSDGTLGGSTVNIGAWDGIVTQIGYVAPGGAGIPPNLRFTALLNADRTIDTKYLGGDKPPSAPTLACDWSTFPSLVNLQTGSAFSQSARAQFAGTAAGTASLSVVSVSGTDATAGGWSISGNNLVNAGSATGSGALLVRGTTVGNSTDCSVANWSYINAPTGDTAAPSIPLNITATSGSGTVTVGWDAASDPFTTQAGTGVKNYDVLLGGSPVATVSGAAGLSQALTQYIVGAGDGTPSSTQTGVNWSLGFGGSGIVGAADNLIFRATPIAGNVNLSAKITSLTSTAASPSAGVMARESNDPGSAMVSCRAFGATAGSVDVRFTYRPTTGATRNNAAALSGNTLPLDVDLVRSRDTWTCQYSKTGTAWITVGSASIPLLATLYDGVFDTSSALATNAIAAIDNLGITNAAGLTYAHTTSTGGAYSVKARDLQTPTANVSSASVAVSGIPAGGGDTSGPTITTQPTGSASLATAINWNCGTWSDPAGVATYTPYTATTSGGTYTAQTPQASNLYTQSGLAATTTYFLKCKSTDGLGNVSAFSNIVSATTLAGGGGTLDTVDLFEGTPGDSTFNATIWQTGGGTGVLNPTNRRQYSTFHRSGTTSARFHLDQSYAVSPERTEAKLQGTDNNFAVGVIYDLGVSINLGGDDVAGWATDITVQTGCTSGCAIWDIPFQMHGTGEWDSNVNPNMFLATNSGHWLVGILGSVNSSKPYDRNLQYDCGPIVPGQWADWTFRFRWGLTTGNPATEGFFQAWKDGVQCVDDHGINWLARDSVGPYNKLGIYKGYGGALGSGGPTTRTVFIDEYRVGKESNGVTRADVTPR